MVDVGTHYDLSHLNKKKAEDRQTFAEASSKLFAVPTQFVFSWVDGQLKAALRIQVVAA